MRLWKQAVAEVVPQIFEGGIRRVGAVVDIDRLSAFELATCSLGLCHPANGVLLIRESYGFFVVANLAVVSSSRF